MFYASFIYKGRSSRSPIIGPVNKSFETPAVNHFFFFVSECCKCLLSELVFIFSPFNPQILFGRPLIIGGVAYNFVFSNCIINKGVWSILSFALCMLTRNSVQCIVVNLLYWCYCCLRKYD